MLYVKIWLFYYGKNENSFYKLYNYGNFQQNCRSILIL